MPARARKETGMTEEQLSGAQGAEGAGAAGADEPQIDWKAEARKWEARAKENSKAAKDYEKLKESQMTELERAQKRADDAEAEAKKLKAERDRKAWAEEIAKETGVPAEVLRGETREEMEAHAGAIKPLLPNGNRTHVGSEGGTPVDAPAASGDWLREAIAGI